MRRFLQVGLGVWFAIAMSWTQACVAPTQAADPYSTSNASGAADPPNGYGSASTVGDSHIDARSYRADQGESQALTHYLKAHRLPLVGAQVLDGSGGNRAVVLYGFVGTDFGKSDAAAKSQRFLAGQSVLVDNRIKVRPELLASGGASVPRSSSSSADAASGAAIVGMSLASGSGGFGVGPGSMGPPGGFGPPYNPYPGYPSPGYPGYPSSGPPYGSYP